MIRIIVVWGEEAELLNKILPLKNNWPIQYQNRIELLKHILDRLREKN